MSQGFITASYLVAGIFFIFSLGGLSSQQTARRGNLYGIAGMVIAISATLLKDSVDTYGLIAAAMISGAIVGAVLASRVQMTAMPELVAMLHSFVGLAAVFVGISSYLGQDNAHTPGNAAHIIHQAEIYLGVLIGAVTFTGSVMAFGKLNGRISSKPLALPARHWINLGILLLCIYFGVNFVNQPSLETGLTPLLIMTVLALAFGVHMVLAIGGADMPVVISMLNSYSGWAAAATGFMLSNDLLIVTGALVGSSGAILSYIMCRAMNRRFLSVIAGGFGGVSGGVSGEQAEGEITPISASETAQTLKTSQSVVIVPGYGMAVSHAQNLVSELSSELEHLGIKVRYAIHPVAGRMPGHMNVLLAEARVPYESVFEMDEINPDLKDTDTVIVIGANDIVNPAAMEVENSPIAGMPVIEVWNAKQVIVLKRSMASGYAGVENPLFYRDNTRMLFGDARESMEQVIKTL